MLLPVFEPFSFKPIYLLDPLEGGQKVVLRIVTGVRSNGRYDSKSPLIMIIFESDPECHNPDGKTPATYHPRSSWKTPKEEGR